MVTPILKRSRMIAICLGISILTAAPRAVSADSEEADASLAASAETPRYGAGLRFRYIFVPKGFIELFTEEAPSGLGEPGFAVDFVRRKGDFELTLGLGYDRIRTDDGLWLEKGDQPPAEAPDFVRYDGLGWITAEALFMWNYALHDKFALRYGAGVGLGVIIGDALQTDTTCTGSSTATCTPITAGGQVDDPADIFPVWPVISVRGGAQIRPTPELAINIDLGLRTVPFVGFGVSYLFK